MPDPPRGVKYTAEIALNDASKPVGAPFAARTTGNDAVDDYEYKVITIPKSGSRPDATHVSVTLIETSFPIEDAPQIVVLAILPHDPKANNLLLAYAIGAPKTTTTKPPLETGTNDDQLVKNVRQAFPELIFLDNPHVFAGPVLPWFVKAMGANPTLRLYNLSDADASIDLIIGRLSSGSTAAMAAALASDTGAKPAKGGGS
jgi:hypothetical protein